VYPEEFFKGPVMSRMAVPSWFTYLKSREGNTAQTASTEANKANAQESASLHQLMSSYVEYEHFRGRYEKRGGAVNMAWNPYVVPGFPCVIFDQKASAFHTVGYLSNVVQSLSLEGMSTAINYSLSRTIPEMLDLLNQEVIKTNNVYGSAPLEPITSVRDIIQDFTKAEQFYNALFFQREPMKDGKKASFDFREVIGYERPNGKAYPITLEKNEQGMLLNTLTGTKDIVPLPAFAPVFKQYDTAMRYISRPICTLDEYLTFLHGAESTLEALTVPKGQVEFGDKRFGQNVNYYKRIRRLTYDATYNPTPAEVGIKVTDKGNTVAWEGAPIGATKASQTRADWDAALVAYQAEMYNRQGPQE
jgi:hypothetical protein